ncbi:MAG: hypothetical protein WBD07_03245 [Vicinamibacterales bacterium]
MRPRDREFVRRLDRGLRAFARRHPVPGIRSAAGRKALLEQLVESVRRVRYISAVRTRGISDLRADPSSELFDPLKAAVLHHRAGRIDEAFWLVFLSVHFGKHRRAGWRLARDVYGRLGGASHWNWARTSARPQQFRQWLARNRVALQGDGVARHFGNHRKYQSLDAWSPTGTGAAIESYVRWVALCRSHHTRVQEALEETGRDPRRAFDRLYQSMHAVATFGRTAKFDYLTMIGKLGFAAIEPGSTYLQGATGPLAGARSLFGRSAAAAMTRREIDAWLVQLGADLDVGMHVVEDALCNWQKSPRRFKPFRG